MRHSIRVLFGPVRRRWAIALGPMNDDLEYFARTGRLPEEKEPA